MRERDRKTAERFGVLARVEAFEKSLLEVDGIISEGSLCSGIDFDLSGWLSDIRQVIVVPRYDISVERDDYYEVRCKVIQSVLDVAAKFGLSRTEDRIEDYGAHLYFVFRCDGTWRNKGD